MAHTNLLFIFTDEQRYDTLAAYGNSRIQMPNLNRLASCSTVFERAYVTQPVCTPSRGSLLTGLYPHTHGSTANNIPLADDVLCLPEMLTPGRYATGYHGKWHLGDEIFVQHGFQEWISIEDGYISYYREGRDKNARSSYYHHLVESGFAPADGFCFGRSEAAHLPEEFGKPAFLAREASRFIREHAAEPMALFVNFLEPHMPFTGPRDAQYDPSYANLPPNFDYPPSESNHLKPRIFQRAFHRVGIGGEPLRTADDWRRLNARYWGLCSLVDTHVGTILQTLEECGIFDDTIIVFTSDHGDMMGSHRLVAKCVMFEEAVRVPMLVKLPGQTESRRLGTPVSQLDLAPTLLDILGEPIPPHLEGKSLRSALETGGEPVAEDVFIEWNSKEGFVDTSALIREYPEYLAEIATREEAIAAIGDPIRTIVTADGWKLNYSALGMHELFNLTEDPYEVENLAYKPEMKPRVKDLVGRIERRRKRMGDSQTADCRLKSLSQKC